jgi:hypothetical protein
MTLVAPGVRFNVLAIFATPDLDFAIVFIVRTSSLLHARRTTFLAFGILSPNRIEAEPGFYHDYLRWRSRTSFYCENVNATSPRDSSTCDLDYCYRSEKRKHPAKTARGSFSAQAA